MIEQIDRQVSRLQSRDAPMAHHEGALAVRRHDDPDADGPVARRDDETARAAFPGEVRGDAA